jgi:hypothetical protein
MARRFVFTIHPSVDSVARACLDSLTASLAFRQFVGRMCFKLERFPESGAVLCQFGFGEAAAKTVPI